MSTRCLVSLLVTLPAPKSSQTARNSWLDGHRPTSMGLPMSSVSNCNAAVTLCRCLLVPTCCFKWPKTTASLP